MLYTRKIRTEDAKGCEMHVTVYVDKRYRGRVTDANDSRLYVCDETGTKATTLDELKQQVAAL